MIAMVAVFFLLVLMFGFIGAARGWGKEVLVVASVVLALAIITIFEDFLRLQALLSGNNQFYFRIFIVTMVVYFGYQSPQVGRIARATEKRAQIGEKILSFVMGMISGYFVIGTYWHFANDSQYPGLVSYTAPASATLAETTSWVLSILPPLWLDDPISVFIALVVIVLFIIVYFV